MGMIKEFKAFAVKGNVIDMAVGIIIGAAFGKIVSSFVKDVLMPPIGLLLGDVDFTQLVVTLSGEGKDAVVMRIGIFIQYVVDFLIVAFAIFMVIRVINNAKKKEEEKPSAPPAPSKEELLLTEIRDLLKEKS